MQDQNKEVMMDYLKMVKWILFEHDHKTKKLHTFDDSFACRRCYDLKLVITDNME
jgi:hypothetical protein